MRNNEASELTARTRTALRAAFAEGIAEYARAASEGCGVFDWDAHALYLASERDVPEAVYVTAFMRGVEEAETSEDDVARAVADLRRYGPMAGACHSCQHCGSECRARFCSPGCEAEFRKGEGLPEERLGRPHVASAASDHPFPECPHITVGGGRV